MYNLFAKEQFPILKNEEGVILTIGVPYISNNLLKNEAGIIFLKYKNFESKILTYPKKSLDFTGHRL